MEGHRLLSLHPHSSLQWWAGYKSVLVHIEFYWCIETNSCSPWWYSSPYRNINSAWFLSQIYWSYINPWFHIFNLDCTWVWFIHWRGFHKVQCFISGNSILTHLFHSRWSNYIADDTLAIFNCRSVFFRENICLVCHFLLIFHVESLVDFLLFYVF